MPIEKSFDQNCWSLRPKNSELFGWAALAELRDVASDQQNAGLEAHVVLDRSTASRLGITPQMIDDALFTTPPSTRSADADLKRTRRADVVPGAEHGGSVGTDPELATVAFEVTTHHRERVSLADIAKRGRLRRVAYLGDSRRWES